MATQELVARYILLDGEKANDVVAAYAKLGVETSIDSETDEAWRVVNPESGVVMLYTRGTEEMFQQVAQLDGVRMITNEFA